MEDVLTQTIDYARERCEALFSEIDKLEQKDYPTKQSQKILFRFIKGANEQIRLKLDEIEKDTEIRQTLKPEELEQRVKRYCKFLPYLCNLLEYIEGSEIENTPAPLINPLRRLTRSCLPDSEVIFRSYSQLNYSYAPLTRLLREVFSDDTFSNLVQRLPNFFAVISFPKVEANYVLLHCMVAHEIGHGLYQEKNLEDDLIPLVKIDETTLDRLAKEIVESESNRQDVSGKDPLAEADVSESLRVKGLLTQGITKIIGNWVEELTADAFGVCIFGPSYFFAFINFVSAIRLLQSASFTHPSPRIRMNLMSHILNLLKPQEKDESVKSQQKHDRDTLGFENVFQGPTKRFVQKWVEVSSMQGRALYPIYDIVEKSITPIIPGICSKVMETMNGSEYTAQKYLEKTPTLRDLIVNIIPPNEVIDFKKKETTNTDVVSILNAGWEVYISHMDDFAKNYQELTYQSNKLKCDKKLNELLLKAIELNEIKTRWDEIGK
jgi:hypothetical protein